MDGCREELGLEKNRLISTNHADWMYLNFFDAADDPTNCQSSTTDIFFFFFFVSVNDPPHSRGKTELLVEEINNEADESDLNSTSFFLFFFCFLVFLVEGLWKRN